MKQYYLWLLLDDLSLRTLPSQIQSNNWELTNLSYSFVFHFSQTIPCHQYGSCFWLGFLESIPFSYFFFKQLVAVKLNGGLHILCWSWVVRLRDSKKNVKISIITAVDWTCWLNMLTEHVDWSLVVIWLYLSYAILDKSIAVAIILSVLLCHIIC